MIPPRLLKQTIVNLQVRSTRRLDGEALLRDTPRFPTHVLPLSRVGQKLLESHGQSLMVSDRRQVASAAFHYDALRTTAASGNDRNAAGHRFGQNDPKSLLI